MAVRVSTLCGTDPAEQHTLQKAGPHTVGQCSYCPHVFDTGEEYVSCSGNCGACCIACDTASADDEDEDEDEVPPGVPLVKCGQDPNGDAWHHREKVGPQTAGECSFCRRLFKIGDWCMDCSYCGARCIACVLPRPVQEARAR